MSDDQRNQPRRRKSVSNAPRASVPGRNAAPNPASRRNSEEKLQKHTFIPRDSHVNAKQGNLPAQRHRSAAAPQAPSPLGKAAARPSGYPSASQRQRSGNRPPAAVPPSPQRPTAQPVTAKRPTVQPAAVPAQRPAVQPAARRRVEADPRKSKKQNILLAVFAIILAALVGTMIFLIATNAGTPQNANSELGNVSETGWVDDTGKKLEGATETVDKDGVVHGVSKDGVKYVLRGRGETCGSSDKVTLAAVGDQIATDNSLPIADRYDGGTGDGKYDFAPFYKNVKGFINKHDLRFINQETVMATGGSNSRVSGYPMFNSPDNMAETISKVGFNMVNFCSNHIYDAGVNGIKASHAIWSKYPKITVAGSYLTKEDRDTVHLIERNGLTFAFLAYTYGDNSFSKASQMPNQYYLATFNKKKMKKEIAQAKKVADVVIVAMHWGTEYVSEPNKQQQNYAAFLADQGVDLVLGSHAHCTQPVRYITGESGNTIPVVFGLSDFVSGWTLTDTILSGIFTCDFVRGDWGVEVKNPTWYPCIEWSSGGSNVTVRRLCDMTKDEINKNTRTEDVKNDYAYIKKAIKNMHFDVPVKMTPKDQKDQ